MSQLYNYGSGTPTRYSQVNLFSTSGRIGQKRYFVYSILIPFAIFLLASSVAAVVNYLSNANMKLLYGISGIAIILMLAVLVRLTIQRCHDFNRSKALALLAIIPLANIAFSLITGTNGLNRYGEKPQPATPLINGLFSIIISVFIIAVLAFLGLLAQQLLDWEFARNLTNF